MGSPTVLVSVCFPLCRDPPAPKCKSGKDAQAQSMQASSFSDEESMPRKGQLWPVLGWPRVFGLRQLGQGWVEATYQYCPPESTRYISSEDSLR